MGQNFSSPLETTEMIAFVLGLILVSAHVIFWCYWYYLEQSYKGNRRQSNPISRTNLFIDEDIADFYDLALAQQIARRKQRRNPNANVSTEQKFEYLQPSEARSIGTPEVEEVSAPSPAWRGAGGSGRQSFPTDHDRTRAARPTDLAQALASRDRRMTQRLLETCFDQVAAHEYSWLKELVQLGFSPLEIANELLEKSIHGPWIYESFEAPGSVPRSEQLITNFHRRGCVHGHANPSGASETEPRATPVIVLGPSEDGLDARHGELSECRSPGSHDSSLKTLPLHGSEMSQRSLSARQRIEYLCGLAGVRPAHDGSAGIELGFVFFEENNSSASITLNESEDNSTVLAVLRNLGEAAGELQRLEGCCNSFTILFGSNSSEGHVELHRVPFSVICKLSHALSTADEDASTLADALAELSFLSDVFKGNQTVGDLDSFVNEIAIVTQFLALGLLSYAQAHCGPLQPFFLDTPLQAVSLLGYDISPTESIPTLSLRLVELTCMGDMVEQPVLAFNWVRNLPLGEAFHVPEAEEVSTVSSDADKDGNHGQSPTASPAISTAVDATVTGEANVAEQTWSGFSNLRRGNSERNQVLLKSKPTKALWPAETRNQGQHRKTWWTKMSARKKEEKDRKVKLEAQRRAALLTLESAGRTTKDGSALVATGDGGDTAEKAEPSPAQSVGVFENTPKRRMNVLASPEDVLDTWGPGYMLASADDPSTIYSIFVGSGIITSRGSHHQSPGTMRLHWSRNAHESSDPAIPFHRSTKAIIGATIFENTNCQLSAGRLKDAIPFLEEMGTSPSYWEVAERQIGVGIQGGQTAVGILQFTQGWVKMMGTTKKAAMLSQRAIFISDLESMFGVQVSICTGIARRVRLRDLLADLLPAYISGLVAKPPLWDDLDRRFDVVKALRVEVDLRRWLEGLDHACRAELERLVFAVLHLLRDTGVDRRGEELVVACVRGGGAPPGCFRVPCRNENYWARMLADSEDAATFAYATVRCLQTAAVGCCRPSPSPSMSWAGSTTTLLGTAVSEDRAAAARTLAAAAASGRLGPWALKEDEAYLIGRPDRALFVLVKRPSGADPQLLVSLSAIPREFLYRLSRKGKMKRLREKKYLDDCSEDVVVFVKKA